MSCSATETDTITTEGTSSITSTQFSSATTLLSQKFTEDFYTSDEIVVFAYEFDEQLFEK